MIESYIINYDAPWFEVCLENNKKIDILLDNILNQIKLDNPRLNEHLDSYTTYEDMFDYLEWCQIEILPYLENYLIKLTKDSDNMFNNMCVPEPDNRIGIKRY